MQIYSVSPRWNTRYAAIVLEILGLNPQRNPLPNIIPFDKDAPVPLAECTSTVAGLFRMQARKIFRLLQRKLGNKEDAEDAGQEVFLRLWRQEQRGVLRDEAVAYMHAAATTVAIDAERRRRSHGFGYHDEVDEQELPPTAPDLEDMAHWREGMGLLVNSLKQLPETTQQVFLLYHFDALSHVEIAQRLNLSTRSIERHMARALVHCKASLKDYL